MRGERDTTAHATRPESDGGDRLSGIAQEMVAQEILALEADGWFDRLLARSQLRHPTLLLDLEDAVSTAKVRALEQAAGLRSQAPPTVRAWVQTIAQNEIRAVVRRWRSRPRLVSLDNLIDDPPAKNSQQELDERDRLGHRLELLPAQARRVVELRLLDGLSFAEIGDAGNNG